MYNEQLAVVSTRPVDLEVCWFLLILMTEWINILSAAHHLKFDMRGNEYPDNLKLPMSDLFKALSDSTGYLIDLESMGA